MTENPFESRTAGKIKKAVQSDTFSGTSNALFGDFVDRNSEQFETLKSDLKMANIDILFRTYVSELILSTIVSGVLAASVSLVYSFVAGIGMMGAARLTFGVSVTAPVIIFVAGYTIPGRIAKKRERSIDANLPFALNHLSAISSSGLPPASLFELLESFDEYGEIQTEAKRITERTNVFGEDITTALDEISKTTPSQRFAGLLRGLKSTIDTGGDLSDFINERAEEELFRYNVRKEKEIERLSTYASFYTALLIAAPVFLVVVLAIINLLQEQVAGFKVTNLMFLGIHVLIPFLNLAFIIFLVIKLD